MRLESIRRLTLSPGSSNCRLRRREKRVDKIWLEKVSTRNAFEHINSKMKLVAALVLVLALAQLSRAAVTDYLPSIHIDGLPHVDVPSVDVDMPDKMPGWPHWPHLSDWWPDWLHWPSLSMPQLPGLPGLPGLPSMPNMYMPDLSGYIYVPSVPVPSISMPDMVIPNVPYSYSFGGPGVPSVVITDVPGSGTVNGK